MKLILVFNFVLFSFFVKAQVITTVAGNGSGGYGGDGDLATAASLAGSGFIFFDKHGSLYIEELNNTVRKISPSDTITTIAGNGTSGFSGDGFPATNAQFNFTGGGGMAFDNANNLYIADQANNRIRKVDAISGIVTTIAGTGTPGFGGDSDVAISALFNSPVTVAFDTAGNLYVLDGFNYRIRKINATGIISTIAGTGTMGFSGDGGPATGAEIYAAGGMRMGKSNCLYIADGIRIRKINLTNDTIITVAGNGIFGYGGDGGNADSAGFTNTTDVVQDAVGNLYISDRGNNRIRKVDTAGIITTAVGNGTGAFSGDGFPATSAEIYSPRGVAVDVCGNLFIADNGNARIRKVTYPPELTIPTISLSGTTTVPAGATVTVTATVANAGSSYVIHWLNHGIEFTTTTIPVVTYTKPPGIDTITALIVPTGYGCWDSSVSAAHVVGVNTAGVAPSGSQRELTCYPNPAGETIYVNGLQTMAAYRLLSIVGAVVQQGNVGPGSGVIFIGALPAGVYVLEVSDGKNQKSMIKIIKQ